MFVFYTFNEFAKVMHFLYYVYCSHSEIVKCPDHVENLYNFRSNKFVRQISTIHI